MSEGMVCMSLSDWGEINKMVSAFCSAQGINCDYVKLKNGQTLKQALNGFFLRLQLVSAQSFEQIE